jgi:hypothetical protein
MVRLALSEEQSFDAEFSVLLTFIAPLRRDGEAVGVHLAELLAQLRESRPELLRDFFEPQFTFFREIVNIPHAPLELPVTFLLQPAGRDDAERVTLWRPDPLRYAAEGARYESPRPGPLSLAFRDSLTLFASGHIAYHFAVLGRSGEAGALDAHDLLALQKLVDPTEDCEHLREALLWSIDGEAPLPLLRFVARRAERLLEAPGNALSEVAARYLAATDAAFQFRWSDLRGAAIQVNDPTIYRLLCSGSDKSDEAAWRPSLPLRALAGLIQNVADFANQDDSEVADSLRPIHAGADFRIFNHPRFLVEFSENSRSFTKMVGRLGGCPYLFLTHLTLVYNELLLSDCERAFVELKYGSSGQSNILVRPLSALSRLLDNVTMPFIWRSGHLRRVVGRDLVAFRDLHLNYLPNIFRYETERASFEAAQQERGLALRRAQLDELSGRHHMLVESIQRLGELEAESRMNRLLFVLTLLGAAGALSAYVELYRGEAYEPAVAVAAQALAAVVAALSVALLLLWCGQAVLRLCRLLARR